ncbi:MAG: response regulator [Symploca sp. SIO2B6]|nr:response regulator [Symploca sp. SIO2B6]
MKILLVEDDEGFTEVIKQALSSQHYLVDLANDGQAGWELAESFEYDLILLDWMLPKLNGIDFCQRRRQMGDLTPIILMTAQDNSTNKVVGLDTGADDYLVKPFEMEELLARIRALLRRGCASRMPMIECGCLRLNPGQCQVTYQGKLLHLTPKEYALLELFLRNPQRIFSQSALLDHLWSFEEPPSENAVRTQIKGLRKKLKQVGAATDLIETVYGLGYRLKSEVESQHLQQRKEENGVLEGTSSAQFHRQKLSGLATIWEQYKSKYISRLSTLEQALIAWREGNLTPEVRQEALKEAHTLAGSLGSFGFTQASRQCREIEQVFKFGEIETKTILDHLSELVVLRQELETGVNREATKTNLTAQVLSEQTDAQRQKPSQAQIQTSRGQEKIISTNNLSTHTSLLATSLKQQPRLLIIDDDVALAQALVLEAIGCQMQAEAACDLSQLRKAIALRRPDVVLLDLCFPDSTEKGFELLAQLKATQPSVPVLVFTAQESFADRLRVARLGGGCFLHKPMEPNQVIAAITQVLQTSSSPSLKLLIVDDDPQMLDFLRILLDPWGFELILLEQSQHFWEILEACVPDLLILDVEMPEFSGLDLCQVVRNEPRWQDLPVIFLSAHTDAKTVQQVFTVGADDYVQKPIVGPELIARVLNRIERSQLRRRISVVDTLFKI